MENDEERINPLWGKVDLIEELGYTLQYLISSKQSKARMAIEFKAFQESRQDPCAV